MAQPSTIGAGSPTQRPASHKWLFSKEEMRNTASMREGMSREEELSYRQMAAAFIQEMVDGLNNIKDPKLKIGHTGLCVAHMHMHRFYYWHSFKKYDYRDVGAACVFVAGKSQECPRKLSHVVAVWRDRKDRKQLTTDAARNEAAQIIVLLESMILQTIAFDLNILLPHTIVLEVMKKVDKEETYKNLTTCAYYFATDVMAVTDWSLRYSAHSMSIAIIHLMAAYSKCQIETIFAKYVKEGPWYKQFDETMTDEKLREMELEFLNTYRHSCQFHHASKYIADFAPSRPAGIENHPNVGKIPYVNCYERTRDARSHSPMVQPYAPDSTMNGAGRPRGYVPKDELTVERLNRERVFEEERRKRDHDRMAGRLDNSTSSSSEKRARIEPISTNFVSSSTSSNGKLAPPPIPPQLNFPPPPYNTSVPPPSSSGSSGYNIQRNQNQNQSQNQNRRPTENKPMGSLSPASFRASYSARAFDVAPMLTPPVAPKLQSTDSSDMDLEDGEVE